jgi:hypothetical protein
VTKEWFLRLSPRAALLSALGASLAMGLGACSGDTPGSGSPGGGSTGGNADVGPVSLADFPTAFASNYCDNIAACCRQAGYDPSSCRTTLEPRLAALASQRLSNPKVVYDGAGARNCMFAYRDALTACTNPLYYDKVAFLACALIFDGTVPVGGACAESAECAPSPSLGTIGCEAGVCTVSDPFAGWTEASGVGQPCAATCRGDDNGYSCTRSGTSTTITTECWINNFSYCSSGLCAALPAIGQPCGDGIYCATSAHCENGTCMADIATGPCSSDDYCVSTSYCDTTTRQCTPIKADGTACSLDSECLGGQCEAGRCRPWSMATASACAGLQDDLRMGPELG